MNDYENESKWDDKDELTIGVYTKKNNVLPLWGNERTMNLNNVILTNIQASPYFKVNLYELKTYHEVIDEIYYKVSHTEPWEKGSRKTAGQTGMCGGVRGVGAGGIVSTAFCLLYKLFTLKLTRKQVIGLVMHPDSPYIRILGFMYIRYTQPPSDLWDWYEQFLDDSEEADVKAGGGQTMTIGEILKSFLTKQEWFSALFPRIPLPVQKCIDRKLNEKFPSTTTNKYTPTGRMAISSRSDSYTDYHTNSKSSRYRSSSREMHRQRSYDREGSPRYRYNGESRHKKYSNSRDRSRSMERRRDRSRSLDKRHKIVDDSHRSDKRRYDQYRGDEINCHYNKKHRDNGRKSMSPHNSSSHRSHKHSNPKKHRHNSNDKYEL